MFIENKYTKYYYKIISNANNRIVHGYTERHHIIPESMGGTDEDKNLVRLTAKEHFVCHLLLTKMIAGPMKHKALKAARMMAKVVGPGQQRHKVTGRIYEMLAKEKIEVSDITREKMGVAQKRRFATSQGTFKNKTHTESTLKKLRKPKTEEQKQRQSQIMKGRFKGRIPHNKGKTLDEMFDPERVITIKEKQRHIGEKNGFYGKKHTPENRQKKREEKLNAPRQQCPYCNKIIDPMNYARWHGDKCKNR